MAEGITVHLGGRIGTLFGTEWKGLRVSSPAEAFRAIDVNTNGAFRRYLSQNRATEYHICIDKESEETCLFPEELKSRTGKGDIYLIPAIKGKNSGWVRIVAGVILIIVGIILYAYGGQGAVGAGLTLLQEVGVATVGIGASLVFGGISQLLTSAPQQQQQLQSYDFQGNASTVTQGGCVPIFYGRYLVTPLPICISFSAEPVTNSTGITRGGGGITQGDVNQTTLPGNNTQYTSGPSTAPDLPAPPNFEPWDGVIPLGSGGDM